MPMTALEKLIKLASTDASSLYREAAKEAQKELDAMRDELKKIYDEYWRPVSKESCTPTDNVVK